MHNTQSDRPESRSTRNAPRICEFSSGSRAGGLKGFLFAVVIGIGASLGWSQPVPDTILLPDSLGPLRMGTHLAFGSSTDNIYVASESADVLVVDGSTFQRKTRINTGTPVGGALLVNQHNKLYCFYPQQGLIGVIDCATNTIVGSIDVGTRPALLCYSSGSDKLYCGDTIDRTVTAIDCAADTVCGVVSVGRSLTAMAYDPTTNKVYAATKDALLAISCTVDSVTANISAAQGTRGLYVNKRRQKLYAIGPLVLGADPETLYVISTVTDSVMARAVWYKEFLGIACNEATDRLYGQSDYAAAMLELDCVGDTLLRGRDFGSDRTLGPVCDSARNRLYFLLESDGWGYLTVVDCVTLDVISQTRLGDNSAVLELDPGRRRVMCGGDGMWARGADLAVFDCKSESLGMRATVPLCGWYTLFGQRVLRHNPVSRKFYYRWGNATGGVGVIDEQTNKVVRHVILPQLSSGADLEFSRTSNKLYCGSEPGLAVLDGASDSLVKLIELAGGTAINLGWCPDYNKLYCTGMPGPRWYMAVVDCYSDSVIKEIEFYDFPGRPEYIGSGRLLYNYGHRLALIDCRNDSILADIDMGSNVDAVGHSTADGKIYVVQGLKVEVLSDSTLSLLTTVNWDYSRGADPFLMCSDTTHKLYWFVRDQWSMGPDSVLAIDTRSDTVVARLGMGFAQMQTQGCFDHSGRYIFNPDLEDPYNDPDSEPNRLIVYDTQLDTVAAVYKDLPVMPLSAIPNPEQRSIYVACADVILVYPDVPPGVQEERPQATSLKPQATVVRGVLDLQPADYSWQSGIALLDVTGRKILSLRPGENDVCALSPGIYFVRTEETTRIRKIVITR
jgi:DNA-binding beta-propeller fold protein YncE